MSKYLLGFATGFLLACLIAGQFKNHDLPAQPTTLKVYEDGSFTGCMTGGLCND